MAITFTYECKKPRKFPPTFLLDIKYLAKVIGACQSVLEEATDKPDQKLFNDWFGDFGEDKDNDAKFQKCQVHTDAILTHATKHPIVLNQSSAITLAMTDQSKSELEINLGTYTALNIYSLGELVVTVLHEISHKTPNLMTKDIVVGREPSTALGPGSNIYAYKGKAVSLAQENPEKAFQNAENWGYYLASYHQSAGLAEIGSWDYTKNQKDIDGKTVNNPSFTKGDLWGGGKWIAHKGRGCVADPGGELPIIRYKVNGDATTYDRADTPLPGDTKPSAPASSGVTHVKKAITDDGPHKCDKCNRGFPSPFLRNKHRFECKK